MTRSSKGKCVLKVLGCDANFALCRGHDARDRRKGLFAIRPAYFLTGMVTRRASVREASIFPTIQEALHFRKLFGLENITLVPWPQPTRPAGQLELTHPMGRGRADQGARRSCVSPSPH